MPKYERCKYRNSRMSNYVWATLGNAKVWKLSAEKWWFFSFLRV